MLLKDFMREALADWENDLPQVWQDFLGRVDLRFEAMGDLAVTGSPPNLRPRRGGPGGSHIFKAFDGIAPDDVRVLAIGQDPYSKPGQATGRGFEDGLFEAWDGPTSSSIKRLRRAALDRRLPGERIFKPQVAPWKKLQRRMIRHPEALGEPVSTWFDDLERQGVMFVNAAMTLTEFRRPTCRAQRAHVRLWHPFICRLACRLAARPNRDIVFLLFGDFAKNAFARTPVVLRPLGANAGGRVVDVVEHCHPSYGKFFESNPLEAVDEALGGVAIRW